MVNERIKEIRTEKELTQKEIADLLNMKQPQYARYENGKRELPITHLKTLAEYYNISADYILGIIEEQRPIK